jgi:hypothetical protein
MKRLVLAALVVLAMGRTALAAPWQPPRTWAFVVGILEWQDGETWAPFPKTHRRDAQLVESLKARGVPADHIVYLQDREARIAAVEAAFHRLLAKGQPGDDLIVYFAGHGDKDEDGCGYLITWDAGEDLPSTTWPMASVVSDIERRFKGARALLMADCCYSGTLAEKAEEARGPVRIACLASSSSSASSTGAWTFTESVLEGLRGGADVDLDRNGEITLDEMARYIAAEMAFADEQRAQSGHTPGYEMGEVMAKASPSTVSALGEHVEVHTEGKWWPARVIGRRSGEIRVHYYGYETSDDAWVKPAQVRRKPIVAYKKGAHVLVLWKKEWYPAVVLESAQGMHYIHYDGYKKTWDEWVDSKRIKPAS